MPHREDDQHTDDQYRWHMERIDEILAAFQDGAMTVTDKRKAIASENEIYYGGDFRSPVTGERITRMPRSR